MRKNYLKSFLLVCGLSAATLSLADNTPVVTKAVYTYGAMLDEGYSRMPTNVVHSFYDANNRLVREMEAEIMLADSEGTPDVEVPGQVIPKLYTAYEYDDAGNLLKVRTRKHGLYSVFDRIWLDYTDTEAYEYDENGRLIKKTDISYITNYVWEGENLVEETAYYVSDSTWSNTWKYMAFAEGTTNRPTSAIYSDKWNNRYIYEYDYDNDGNKVLMSEYKLVDAETDDKGAVLKANKSDLNSQTTWTYADGMLVEEMKGFWNKSKSEVIPDSKVTYTVEDDTTTVATFRYFNNNWGRFGGVKKHVKGTLDASYVATNLQISNVANAVNTVLVTAQAPTGADADGWIVYRNGAPVGEATLADGQLSYKDSLVVNGTWDYFIQHGDNNISEIVSKTFNTALTGVKGVKFLKNSLNETGDYQVIFTWTTPESQLPILGYNVYADLSSVETNPAPENGMEIIPTELAMDTLTWLISETELNHKIYIETVYSIGKVRSEAINLKLMKEEKPLLTKVIMTMGDAMGNASNKDASKAETYYYDVDGKLLRKMIYGKMLGDDESDPDQFYKAGDWVPVTYTAYDYNEQNQLVGIRQRQYGVYSGYNKAWNDFEEYGSFSYSEDGRMSYGSNEPNRCYYYKYDGDNVVQETYTNSGTVTIYHKYFSDFVEGLVNCPRYAFANSPYGLTTNDRIYEYTYDAIGNKTSCRAYKYDNSTVIKDEEGNVIGAEKGTPDYEEIWTYQNNILVKYEKNMWKASKNQYEPKSRIEYTLTPMGTEAVSWSYSVGIWAKGGTPQVTWDVPFEGIAPSNLTVTDVEGKVNTVLLKAAKPANALATTVWNVFRNGVKIGQATSSGRSDIVYEDVEVPNGHWDYFIQAQDNHGAVGVNISNVVEKDFQTELPAVTDIKVVKNEYNDVQDYELVLDWEAPVTELPIKGYNMFVDLKSFTKNPSPVNGLYPFTESSYTYTAANDVNPNKTFVVETVYNIGKVKSEAIAVVLQKANAIGAVTVDNLLMVVDKTLLINGEYNTLDLYGVNGTLVGNYSGTTRIDLSSLNSGVYVVRANTADGVFTGKITLK